MQPQCFRMKKESSACARHNISYRWRAVYYKRGPLGNSYASPTITTRDPTPASFSVPFSETILICDLHHLPRSWAEKLVIRIGTAGQQGRKSTGWPINFGQTHSGSHFFFFPRIDSAKSWRNAEAAKISTITPFWKGNSLLNWYDITLLTSLFIFASSMYHIY